MHAPNGGSGCGHRCATKTLMYIAGRSLPGGFESSTPPTSLLSPFCSPDVKGLLILQHSLTPQHDPHSSTLQNRRVASTSTRNVLNPLPPQTAAQFPAAATWHQHIGLPSFSRRCEERRSAAPSMMTLSSAFFVVLPVIWQQPTGKNRLHFSICACHPCAGAMLIFSVSFQPTPSRASHLLAFPSLDEVLCPPPRPCGSAAANETTRRPSHTTRVSRRFRVCVGGRRHLFRLWM